jgi:hypothetical protein
MGRRASVAEQEGVNALRDIAGGLAGQTLAAEKARG